MLDVYKRQGYASTEDASKFNKFDIVVNTKDHTIVSVTPTEAVSYTHLDVYKRQLLGFG